MKNPGSGSSYQSESKELKLDSNSKEFYLSLPAYLREIVEMLNNGEVTASHLAGIVVKKAGIRSEIDFDKVDNTNTVTKTVLEWLQEINTLFEHDHLAQTPKSKVQARSYSQASSKKK